MIQYTGSNGMCNVYRAKWWTRGDIPSNLGVWEKTACKCVIPEVTNCPSTNIDTPNPNKTTTNCPSDNPNPIPNPTPTPIPDPIPNPNPNPIPEPTPQPDPNIDTSVYGRWYQELLSQVGQAFPADQLKDVGYYVKTLAKDKIDAITPGNPSNPSNVKRVENIIKLADWNRLFPYTNKETAEGSPEGIGIYSYANFLKAVGAFPAYCGDYKNHPNPKLNNTSDADGICRRLLATSFAHFNKETSANAANWSQPLEKQGLYWVREVGCLQSRCSGYTMGADSFPAELQAGQYYYGRGAKQLSHPINYATLSIVLYGDASVLLLNPDLVATTWLALGSAVYFAVIPISSKPSMIEIVDGNYVPNAVDLSKNFRNGFGLTTHIINGGIECMNGRSPIDYSSGLSFAEVRAKYYKYFCETLGAYYDAATVDCSNMRQLFGLDSSASRPYYMNPQDSCRFVRWEGSNTLIAYGGKTYLNKCKNPNLRSKKLKKLAYIE
jgi:hypothetical protein